MVFSSLVFLCIFLPAVLILHSVIKNRRVQNGLLLAASLLFYAYGEPVYVLLMLASAGLNYGFAFLMDKRRRRLWLAAAVIVNIGILCVFKYTGFLVSNFNALTGLSVPVPQISLPIGISFFTFQALSYVIDVYRGEVAPQKNPARLLLYISFFPQLIAGPIVRYKDIEAEIGERTVTLCDMGAGIRRFLFGLGKKVIIANAMGAAADMIFGSGASSLNILSAWIGAIAYLLQIYFDFSGYSDMAIGLGRCFGFHFLENFNHPYLATSMQDFWRRWHISLSSWFRDYVYIPLGGNRKGTVRTVVNRLIVFFLTGLWHGANWTFVVWGLYNGLFLLAEEAVRKVRQKKGEPETEPLKRAQKRRKASLSNALGHLYALLAATVGFAIFRADSISEAMLYLGRMFGGFTFTAEGLSLAARVLTPYFLVMLAAGILCCGPLSAMLKKLRPAEGTEPGTVREKAFVIAEYALSFLLLVWCLLRLAGSSYNPFIYFRF